MLQMPDFFEREVNKLREMIDDTPTQKYLEEKVKEAEERNKCSYADLRRDR